MPTNRKVKKYVCPRHLRCMHAGCEKPRAWWFNPDDGTPHVKLCDRHYGEYVDAWLARRAQTLEAAYA